MPEHGLHAVCSLRVFAEARLTLDGHPRILGNLPQLVCEVPVAQTRSWQDVINPTGSDGPKASILGLQHCEILTYDPTTVDVKITLKVEERKTEPKGAEGSRQGTCGEFSGPCLPLSE